MTGIPGSVGAAVYGNAGAYGHSIDERVRTSPISGWRSVRSFSAQECRFRYRESIFKEHKDWIILSVDLRLTPAPARRIAPDRRRDTENPAGEISRPT